MTMKTLRQGFGRRYAGQTSAHVLQRLMRHSSIRVTMDYYANVDAAVEEAVRRNSLRNSRPTEAAEPFGVADGSGSRTETCG